MDIYKETLAELMKWGIEDCEIRHRELVSEMLDEIATQRRFDALSDEEKERVRQGIEIAKRFATEGTRR